MISAHRLAFAEKKSRQPILRIMLCSVFPIIFAGRLAYDRRDPTKVSWLESSAERLCKLTRFNEGFKFSRIDFLCARREDDCNTDIAAQFLVALEVARIRA